MPQTTMDQEADELIPSLKETYHQGLVLHLHASNPPPKPASDTGLNQGGISRDVELSERYEKSIAERVVLPFTPPAVSITLEKRLTCSIRRIPHVWTARVRETHSRRGVTLRTAGTAYPPLLMAKVFDPVFFDEEDADFFDAFLVRDISVYSEVKAYEQLKQLQGTRLAQFYGLFVAALPAQHNRTVYVILLEKVPGMDLRFTMPPEVAEIVCPKHRDAIFDSVINLFLDICECGVNQQDLQPRNIILRPQKHVVSETRFCTADDCPVAHKIDCDDLHLVMIDFEHVEFGGEQFCASIHTHRQEEFEELKLQFLEEEWLEGRMY